MKVTITGTDAVAIECTKREARQIAYTMALRSVQLHQERNHKVSEDGVPHDGALSGILADLRDAHNGMAEVILDEVGY